MVSTHLLQSSTTSGPSSPPTLLPTAPFATSVFRHIRRICPFNIPTPRGAISSSNDTSNTLLGTTAEESNPLADLGRNLDYIQRLFRPSNGCLPPRWHCPNPSLPQQAIRRNPSNMVENLHSTNLAPERKERGPQNPRHNGHERATHAP